MIADITREIARVSASSTDDLISAAILRQTGQPEIILADLARLGCRKVLPDGTEVFAYDGVDLVRFWPMDVQTGLSPTGFKVTASRQYQLLQ